MRNLMKMAAVLLFVVAATLSTQAQKFGHIDLQALVQVMPERATAETEFNNFQKELEDVLEEMQNNLNTALKEFESMGAEASQIKRDAKVTEIQDMQQRIQNYSQTAQGQLQQKQAEVLKPVYDKAQKAIEDVAKEKGLLYVFEVNSLLYKSNESLDVLPLVKTKLGIQ